MNYCKVSVSIFTNNGTHPVGTAMCRSIKSAMRIAESQAWRQYATCGATNWAHTWVRVEHHGKAWAGFEGDLRPVVGGYVQY